MVHQVHKKETYRKYSPGFTEIVASGGQNPFCKKGFAFPKTLKKLDNKKLLEVQKPFLEKGSGRRRQIRWWI